MTTNTGVLSSCAHAAPTSGEVISLPRGTGIPNCPNTIAQAVANVTINPYSGTYDAAAHNLTGSVAGVTGDAAAVGSSLTFGSSFTDAPGGTGTWNFEGGTNYLDESGTAAVTINKANATVTVNGYSGTYDASAHGATGTVGGVAGDLAASGSSLSLGSSFTDAPGGTANWSFTGGTNYNDQSGTADIVINKANATVTVNGYSGIYDASAHGATGTVVGVAGDLAASGSSLNLGSSFTNAPGGTANWLFTGGTNYNDQSGTAAIAINKASQTITWSNPAAINYGTPLSGTQLNATVLGVTGGSAAGALTYSPSAGAVLLAGTQTLMVTAAATTNYLSASKSVSLVVNPYISSGFLSPISLNRAFKLGSTVPIKWQLSDASGNAVTSLAAVTTLKVTGPGGTTLLYPGNNSSSGSTVLRHDGSQFIYNWQTKGFALGNYTITATLADGGSVTQTIMLSTSGAAASLVIDGVTGSTAVGALLAGDVTLYVDNSSGGFSSDELARIEEAIAGIELLVSPYGANIIVVDSSVGLNANIVLDSGTTSVLGGMADGVLGVTTTTGEITIIDGWNWFAGADSSTIGLSQYDFQTVITHEIGHSLGLGHSDVNSSVMFPALATTEARRTVVFADLNTAGEEGNGSGLHAEAIYAANLNQNEASAGRDSSPLSPARNLNLAGRTGFAATPLRSIVKELTTDQSLNVATADVSNRRDLNTGLRRAAKESAWRIAIGSSEVEMLTDGQDIDSFFASLTDNDGEMLDNLMDSAFSELRN